ncbi:Flp family type IVb pilin [Sphingomonas sp. YR710]|uniref:Flp family type IVb pilin n=1 Tax=Sphingomonas sp. YR710 TaxID=1882773 RepID=UPI00210DD96B|nr:Flp family type IVb pilin [Sphingomonas sp. YR710]
MTIGLSRHVTALWRDDRGATAVEYGLVLALITLASLGALATMADTVVGMWTDIAIRVAEI